MTPGYLWRKYIIRQAELRSPIFIVGSEHSGTSILLAILSSHRNIFAIPYESNAATKSERKLNQYLKRFDRLAIGQRKKRWVEKSPVHIKYIEKILSCRNDAKIIIITRDGRDVAFSIKKRTGNLTDGAKLWVEYNKCGCAFWEHPNVHVVKYESIISDFDRTLKDITVFLEEDYTTELKDYWKTPRKYYAKSISKPTTEVGSDHNQYRNWQINQPLFDGRGRWKQMSQDELDQIGNIIAPMQRKLGYASDNL